MGGFDEREGETTHTVSGFDEGGMVRQQYVAILFKNKFITQNGSTHGCVFVTFRA